MSDVPRLILRAEWVAAGLTDETLHSSARRRGWTRVGPGAWVHRTDEDRPYPAAYGVHSPCVDGRAGCSVPCACRVRAEALAAALRQRRNVTLGPVDSALAWGLPGPLGGFSPFLLAASTGRSRSGARTPVLVRPELDPAVVLPMTGVAAAGPLTTVIDCARVLPGRDALAVADAALRAGIVVHADLMSGVESVAGLRGASSARRVIALADGRRESPLESWSCWSFACLGVPAPRWQVPVLDRAEGRGYRLDCLWEERLAGEADGRSKALLRAAEAGGATAERLAAVLEDERRREARLRALGFVVLRWSARDVLDDDRALRLASLIRRQLAC